MTNNLNEETLKDSTASPNDLESEVLRIGRWLFHQSKNRKSKITQAWWSSQLMDFALQDEKLKVQLFRFVDVLPTLRTNREIGQHLKEYFDSPGQRFPGVLSWGASLANVSFLAAAASAIAIRKSTQEMARTFIAGENTKEAIKKVESFRKFGMGFTLDLLGEAIVSESEADYYHGKYMEILDALAKTAPSWKTDPRIDEAPRGSIPRINLSVKLSALYSQIDPIAPQDSLRGIRNRLYPLLQRAREAGAFVNIDMEDYRLKNLTLDIFKKVAMAPEFREWADIGIVIQAYLKDSAADLDDLIECGKQRGTPFTVRLVKGAYWDYETIIAQQRGWPCPVFERKPDTDANFEICVQKLLDAYPVVETAIASHNIRSVAFALAAANMRGLPKNAYEIQTLYGMARPMKDSLAEENYRVRVYMPFGELLPGMAYLVRRLLENTSNESFLRKGFIEGAGEEELLRNPRDIPLVERKAKIADGDFKNEPELAFFLPWTRSNFNQALAQVKTKLGAFYPIQIGPHALRGEDGEILSRNPADREQIVGRVASASVSQADLAVAKAKAAFPAWRATTVKQRAAYLRKAASLMRDRKLELSALELLEAAKPRREADGDIAEAIDFLEYYAHEAERLMSVRYRTEVPGEINEDHHQPRGVAAIIAPWNFPLAILTGMTSAALVTGNTVIMKPAEQTPVVAAKLMAIFKEVGIPDGVLSYLPGRGETVGARLVEHPDVNLIAFTGSKTVGLRINAIAAATREGQQGVKKVICEMGGKNAVIVDSDANLDEAVLGVVHSAFGYAGQKCSACSRAIVIGSAYEPFVTRLVEAVKSIHVAFPEDECCLVPPVIDDKAQQRIQRMIDSAKQEAKCAVEIDVREWALKGSFVGPTVFTDVPPHARIAQEEVFGPVLCVLKAADFAQALEIATDVPYALTGGLYSRSPGNMARAREDFRVGNLYLNRGTTGAKVCQQPFGGFKMSGIGSKAGGPEYLLQFVELRTITENTMRRGFAPEG